jgi:hypothetical protein
VLNNNANLKCEKAMYKDVLTAYIFELITPSRLQSITGVLNPYVWQKRGIPVSHWGKICASPEAKAVRLTREKMHKMLEKKEI